MRRVIFVFAAFALTASAAMLFPIAARAAANWNGLGHYGRAMVLEAQGDTAGAQAEFATAKKLTPNAGAWKRTQAVFDPYRGKK